MVREAQLQLEVVLLGGEFFTDPLSCSSLSALFASVPGLAGSGGLDTIDSDMESVTDGDIGFVQRTPREQVRYFKLLFTQNKENNYWLQLKIGVQENLLKRELSGVQESVRGLGEEVQWSCDGEQQVQG